MSKKFIAITAEGKEFMYKTSSMIAVPSSSAQDIADALTREKYQIKDGQKWHVYNNDWYSDSLIARQIKRYGRRMPVYSYYGG